MAPVPAIKLIALDILSVPLFLTVKACALPAEGRYPLCCPMESGLSSRFFNPAIAYALSSVFISKWDIFHNNESKDSSKVGLVGHREWHSGVIGNGIRGHSAQNATSPHSKFCEKFNPRLKSRASLPIRTLVQGTQVPVG